MSSKPRNSKIFVVGYQGSITSAGSWGPGVPMQSSFGRPWFLTFYIIKLVRERRLNIQYLHHTSELHFGREVRFPFYATSKLCFGHWRSALQRRRCSSFIIVQSSFYFFITATCHLTDIFYRKQHQKSCHLLKTRSCNVQPEIFV